MTSTSSFVAEVLATAGQVEKEDLNTKLGKLSKRIEEVKSEVNDALQKRYVDFLPNYEAALEYSNRVKTVSEDMTAISEKIEKDIKSQLIVSTSELQDISTQLQESKSVLRLLEKLTQIQTCLHDLQDTKESAQFTAAVANVKAIGQILEETVREPGASEIQIIGVLQQDWLFQRNELMSLVVESWIQCVQWTTSGKKDKGSDPGGQDALVELQFSQTRAHRDLVIKALADLDTLKANLEKFRDRFMKGVAEPIVWDAEVIVSVTSNPERLSVHYCPTKRAVSSPVKVLGLMEAAFEFLHKNAFDCRLGCPGDGGREGGDGQPAVTLMRRLGEVMAEPLVKLLIDGCLAHSIPSNSRDLAAFSDVITRTKAFEQKLRDLDFLEVRDSRLRDYVGDVNVLFANKKCEAIQERGRQLMTSHIANMIPVTSEAPFGNPPALHLEGASSKKVQASDGVALAAQAKISAHTLRLPACQVSPWVVGLVGLMFETLQEAHASAEPCAIQLFYCVRLLLEQFCVVVPRFHAQSIRDLPQLTALHHNNCMYLAHQCLVLGCQVRTALPPPLDRGMATFIDLVPPLRRLGAEALVSQLKTQREQLLECLREAQGFTNLSESGNGEKAERAVKQVLHQLQRLSNIWKDVLPVNIFHESIGALLHAVVSELVVSVTSLEDISDKDSHQLHSLVALILANAPALFPTPTTATPGVADEDKEEEGEGEEEEGGGEGPAPGAGVGATSRHVASWGRLTELGLLLTSGLQDIVLRWADGKGPLAAEFGDTEVKALIRAIFQNTDKRAGVMARITRADS